MEGGFLKKEDIMEIKKKNVHMNHFVTDKHMQITLEDDFLILESEMDMDYIIASQGEIKIESVKAQNGKVFLKGKLNVQGLYGNNEAGGRMVPINSEIAFEDSLNVDEMKEGDRIHLETSIEDLGIEIINSRKYNLRAILDFSIQVERLFDAQICEDIQTENRIERQMENLELIGLKMDKKDIFRIKEEIVIAQNKPNIGTLLWKQISLNGLDMRIKENKIEIDGMVNLFFMYRPVEENAPIQWMENQIPIKGNLEVEGCSEDMVSDISAELAQNDINVKTDEDGEARILVLDASIDFRIRLYKEENISRLKDVYSTKSNLKLSYEPVEFLQLQIKNESKCKIEEKIQVEEEKGKILQICNSQGSVKIDETNMVEEGIEVEGILQIRMVYIRDSAERPLRSEVFQIPFTYLIETSTIEKNTHFEVKSCFESLQTILNGDREVLIKAMITFDTLVLKVKNEAMIQSIEEEALKNEELEQIPGIVGYLVRDGDSLWKIAKENYTTVEKIKEINELSSDDAKAGDMIILLKQAKEI